MNKAIFRRLQTVYDRAVLFGVDLLYTQKSIDPVSRQSVMPILSEPIDPFRDFLLCKNTRDLLKRQCIDGRVRMTLVGYYDELHDRRNGLLLLQKSNITEQITYNKRAGILSSHNIEFPKMLDYIQYNIGEMDQIIQIIENRVHGNSNIQSNHIDSMPQFEYNYAN